MKRRLPGITAVCAVSFLHVLWCAGSSKIRSSLDQRVHEISTKPVCVFAGPFSSTRGLRLWRKLIPILSFNSKRKRNNLVTAESPKRILVFGDSNSWGWTPREDQEPTVRWGENVRWPGVLVRDGLP